MSDELVVCPICGDSFKKDEADHEHVLLHGRVVSEDNARMYRKYCEEDRPQGTV